MRWKLILKAHFHPLVSTCSSCSTCGGRPSCRCSTTAQMSRPTTGTTSSGRTWPSLWSWSSPSFIHTPSTDHQRSASHPPHHYHLCWRQMWPFSRSFRVFAVWQCRCFWCLIYLVYVCVVHSLFSWTAAASCQIESCWWTPSSSWLSSMERWERSHSNDSTPLTPSSNPKSLKR